MESINVELDEDTLAFAARVFDLAREGDATTLADLIDGGLPVNLTNAAGDTLLLLAAYHRRAEVVRLLLAAGADVARVNDRGQTALAAATFRQDAEVVRLLLAAGADPAAGPRSALATAEVFGLAQMGDLLRGGSGPRRP